MSGDREAMQTSDYAARREASRMSQVLIMSAFVLASGAAVGFSLSGVARTVTWVLVILIVAFFVTSMLRPVQPSTLTPITRVQAGSWTAGIRVGEFPNVLAERRINPDALLSGSVEFTDHGFVWTPTRRTAKTFGVSSKTWDTTWSVQAKRLRGIGNPVQIDLVSADGRTVTLWMLRGASFDIP